MQAVAGVPLGVGRITVRFAAAPNRDWLAGRACRFAIKRGEFSTLFRPDDPQATGVREYDSLQSVGRVLPVPAEISRSDLTFDIVDIHSAKVVPPKGHETHKPLLDDWWATHGSMVESLAEANTYPLQVENYARPC